MFLSTIDFAYKYVSINCDIVLNDEIFDKNGNVSGGDGTVYEWKPMTIGRLSTIYGNGYAIIGMYIDEVNTNQIGLFGTRGTTIYGVDLQEVDELDFENVYLNGKDQVRTISDSIKAIKNSCIRSGYLKGNTGVYGFCSTASDLVENCENNADLFATNSNCYGIAYNIVGKNSVVKNCINYGNIVGNTNVSGIIGYMRGVLIENCKNYGNISAEATYVAGIVSNLMTCVTLNNCVNYGDIYTPNMACGGLVACSYDSTTYQNCANYGNVYGRSANTFAQTIGWIRNTNSYTCLVFNNCVGTTYSESPLIGSIGSSSGIDMKVYINNCKIISADKCNLSYRRGLIYTISGAADVQIKNVSLDIQKTKQETYLFGVGSTSDEVNVDIQNVKVNIESKTDNAFNLSINTGNSNVKADGVVIIKGKEKNYYGENFSGFYVSWKTGKIGLVALDGRGTFQGTIDEEWLIKKGYTKKEI